MRHTTHHSPSDLLIHSGTASSRPIFVQQEGTSLPAQIGVLCEETTHLSAQRHHRALRRRLLPLNAHPASTINAMTLNSVNSGRQPPLHRVRWNSAGYVAATLSSSSWFDFAILDYSTVVYSYTCIPQLHSITYRRFRRFSPLTTSPSSPNRYMIRVKPPPSPSTTPASLSPASLSASIGPF